MSAKGFAKPAWNAEELPKQLFGYDVVDFLGEGAGSRIYVVSNPANGQLYALKYVVRKEEKDIRFVEQLEAGFDLVKGSRFLPGGYTTDMSWFRKFGNARLRDTANLHW